MAHFAEIDENNIVLRVTVVNNEVITDGDGVEQEQLGVDFLTDLLGGTWKQTSYNTKGGVHKLDGTPFRKNYAGSGYIYDEVRDAFISPKPFSSEFWAGSWILNETTCIWEAPLAYPDDGKDYFWNEDITNWVEFV